MYTSLVNPKSATLATLPSPTWVEIEIIIGTKYIQQAFIIIIKRIAFHNITFHVSLHLPRHFWLLDLCERASYQQDRPYPLQPAEIWIDLWTNIHMPKCVIWINLNEIDKAVVVTQAKKPKSIEKTKVRKSFSLVALLGTFSSDHWTQFLSVLCHTINGTILILFTCHAKPRTSFSVSSGSWVKILPIKKKQ